MNLDDSSQNPVQVPKQPVAAVPQVAPEVWTPPQVPTQAVTEPQVPVQQQPQINVHVAWAKEHIVIEGLWEQNKKRTNWLFRILTLFALTATWFLMLWEATWILKLNLKGFDLNLIYPIVVLLSVIILFVYKKLIGKILGFIVFVIIIGGLWTIALYHSLVPGGPSVFDDNLVFALNDSQNAVVHINTYIGDYALSSKNFSGVGPIMMKWTYQSDRSLLVETGFTQDNIPYLYLNEDNNRNVIQEIYSNLNLYLSDTAVFDLYFKNFLWNYTMDLNTIDWKSLVIHGWIGNSHLTIWNSFENEAKLEIKSARAKITIEIPKNVGVRLYYKQLAGSIELQNFKKVPWEKNYYESLNIGTANKIIEIDTSVGVGKFKAERVD